MISRCVRLAVLMLLPSLSRAEAEDESHERRRPARPAKVTAASNQYVSECGSCHLAYPPEMLPARSWVALLGSLQAHFSENAEVDLATRKQVEAFLTANAGRDVAGPTPLRITLLPWWRREHDDIAPGVFKQTNVLTPANCAACHPAAALGDFGEHAVRIPEVVVPARPKPPQ